MRYWRAYTLVVLFFQICDHAWRKQESRTDEHLHPESEEESPGRVVCIQCTASKAPGQVSYNKKYAAVARVVRPAKDTWVSKCGDLGATVSTSKNHDVQV